MIRLEKRGNINDSIVQNNSDSIASDQLEQLICSEDLQL